MAVSKRTAIFLFGAIAAVVILLLTIAHWRQETVLQIPLQGYPGKSVDFILCDAINGQHGYIVRFGGSETKRPFVSGDVPMDELKAKSRIAYDGDTLTVYRPRGEQMTVPGFVP